MSITRMKTLFKRELLDILRDKKTLVMMILVPIILYPFLIVGMTVLMTSIMASQEEKTYRVAFENDAALATQVERIFAENEEDSFSKEVKKEAKDNIIATQKLLSDINHLIMKQQNHAKIAGNIGATYSALNNAFEMRKKSEEVLELLKKVELKMVT